MVKSDTRRVFMKLALLFDRTADPSEARPLAQLNCAGARNCVTIYPDNQKNFAIICVHSALTQLPFPFCPWTPPNRWDAPVKIFWITKIMNRCGIWHSQIRGDYIKLNIVLPWYCGSAKGYFPGTVVKRAGRQNCFMCDSVMGGKCFKAKFLSQWQLRFQLSTWARDLEFPRLLCKRWRDPAK